MYAYIEGIITNLASNYIVVNNNGIGYQIYTPNPYSFTLNENYRIYVYQYVREDEISYMVLKQ